MRIVKIATLPILRGVDLIVRTGLKAASLAAVASLLGDVACAASSDDAAKLFDAGRAAFDSGDYELALRNYEAAAASGLQGGVVDFNIGVAAYRAGKLNRAEQAFAQAAQSPSMAVLSHYNLGLVAQAKGDRRRADQYFRRVIQSADDERLRNLALRQLRSDESRTRTRWSGYATAVVGYDDNVALAPDSDVLAVSGKTDGFLESQAGATAILDSHWRVEAGLDHLNYLDLDEFDLLSTYAAGRYRFAHEDWRYEARMQTTYRFVGGDSFEARRAISFQGTRELNPEWLFRARYRFSHLDGLGSRDGLDGTRHEVQARFTYTAGPVRSIFSYEYEKNDQRSRALASDRQEVQVLVERELTSQWSVEGDAAVRQSEYDAGGTDTLMEVGLNLARTLNAQWRVVGRFAHSRNESDNPRLAYNVNQVSVGAEIRF
jgi:tetratricopeptide (TPR) repeat protein